MKTIYEQVNLIAHRGLSGEHCENTLPAFVGAGKLPFYGIETDIQFTKDNKIVCFHDKSISRLIGGKQTISELTYAELEKMTFKAPYENYQICSFKQYLRTCKKYKKYCIIEIKFHVNTKQLDLLLRIIRWSGYFYKCIIISFNADVLTYLRGKSRSLRLQLLIKNPIKRYIEFCKKYNIDVSLYERIILKDTVAKINSHGIKVGVWTVNNTDTAQKLINMGVNYITTDTLLK